MSSTQMCEDSARGVAFCPGSYDPITNGHLDIIRRGARVFRQVIVGIAVDAQKDHLFSLEERVQMVAEACAELPNVRVQSFSGLLVEAAHEAGASVLLKGLRLSFDLSHEAPMAYMNKSLRADLETVFMLSDPGCTYLSSSLVKWVCGMGGDISPHVPPAVAERLVARLALRPARPREPRDPSHTT